MQFVSFFLRGRVFNLITELTLVKLFFFFFFPFAFLVSWWVSCSALLMDLQGELLD